MVFPETQASFQKGRIGGCMELSNKVFSGTSLMQLISESQDDTKAKFENEETEAKLSFFLLVRKAFNDAYDSIKSQLVENGKTELGESFSGISGNFIRATYSERGGAKYVADPDLSEGIDIKIDENIVDPEMFDVSLTIKPKTDAVKDYLKKNRELPPGVMENSRSKSISIQPTKEAKAFLESINNNSEDILYDLAIPEVTEDEYGN